MSRPRVRLLHQIVNQSSSRLVLQISVSKVIADVQYSSTGLRVIHSDHAAISATAAVLSHK